MKKILLALITWGMVTFWATDAQAQLPWDEVFIPAGDLCVAMMYDHLTWDHYWEGTYLRQNGNIGTFTRQMAMPMMVLGVAERVNLITSLPYISTYPSAGTQVGQKGIQDLSVSLKVNWLRRKVGNGDLRLTTNTNFNTPVGSYLSDYAPFSIGAGAPEVGMRGIASYKLDKGLVFRTSLAYLWRGQTEIERSYYYQDGSVYSRFMDVPNALNFHAAIGHWFFDNKLRVEATYMSIKCLTGDDIRAYNRPQPTNKVEFNQVGAWVQYHVKAKGLKGLGALAYFNQALEGRNMGKFFNVGAGLTYQFTVYNSKKNSEQ